MITRPAAERVIRALAAEYRSTVADGNRPTLHDHAHEDLPRGAWSISWDGGPDGWADALTGVNRLLSSEMSFAFARGNVGIVEQVNAATVALYPITD